jgi:hypothetical protein
VCEECSQWYMWTDTHKSRESTQDEKRWQCKHWIISRSRKVQENDSERDLDYPCRQRIAGTWTRRWKARRSSSSETGQERTNPKSCILCMLLYVSFVCLNQSSVTLLSNSSAWDDELPKPLSAVRTLSLYRCIDHHGTGEIV